MTRVRYLHNQAGQRIAYADEGQGPMVVLPAWWVSHIERDAEEPAYARFFARLVAQFRVVRFDSVGTGMSDRARSVFTLDSEVADLTALVDHLQAARFHLLCLASAGAAGLAFAAQQPDRVDRIVFYAGWLHGASLAPPEIQAALTALCRADGRLGSRTMADIFYPTLDGEARHRIDSLQRASAEPEMAARFLEAAFAFDLRPLAERVRHPALVVHRKDDQTIFHVHGRALAAALPNASLVTLPGAAHRPWYEDAGAVLDAVEEFLGAPPSARSIEDAAELRCEGEVWRLRFDGRQSLLAECKGLADLARLLEKPGDAIHVLDLLGVAGAERRDSRPPDPAIDREALDEYRRRLLDLDDAIAEAEERADLGRTSKLSAEREALLERLAADTGRGGSRTRRLDDPIERARKAVTARLRDAIRRIKAADRAAGEHLESSIQTGVHCAYVPRHPVRWTVAAGRV